MTTLDDAWNWYLSVRQQAKLTGRLAEKHWNSLGWEGSLGRDDFVRDLDAADLVREAKAVMGNLEDLAVLVLFSVFEASVREFVLAEVRPEVERLSHAALRHAAKEACDRIEHGSFYRVLEPFKSPPTYDLIEQVHQVRQYRNWVAHGRRGPPPTGVTPDEAYDRLTRFLAALQPET